MKKSIFLSFIIVFNGYALSDQELIGSKEAYKLTITGDGIRVGVIDSAISGEHPSLKDKVLEQTFSTVNGKTYTPDYSVDTHGSHVAGIIGAKYIDENNPHGVAYDAKLYGVQIFGNNKSSGAKFDTPNVYNYFKDKDVKIINNSWNSTLYPVVSMVEPGRYSLTLKNYSSTQLLQQIHSNQTAKELNDLAREKKTLVVFAAGNEGIISPGIMALSPLYNEELRSFLAVGSVDSSQITRNQDGKLVVSAKGLSGFSNGLLGAENFSLVAPGSNISNVNAAYMQPVVFGRPDNKLYRTQSGTSMAAPMVSGGAALVAQRFPFLNGKQIADVLLSTANKDYVAPKLTVKETTLKVIEGNKLVTKNLYTIFYIDNEVPTDKKQIEKDLIQAEYWNYYTIMNNLITNYHLLEESEYASIQKVSKESLFGQGILDVAKAMGGLASLDANRLNSSDVSNAYANHNEAYYTIDTQGYEAVFSNDISQKKWDESLHKKDAVNLPTNLANLNVGFIKEGSGKLILTGNNSYEGATIIKNGSLALNNKSENEKARIAGDVKVLEGGLFSGNGEVGKNLENKGIVRAGNEDLSDLIIKGKYTQEGQNSKLQLDFGNDKNSKLIANSYEIKGGKLEYIPLPKFFTSGHYVSIDLGGLNTHLDQFSGVSVMGNNAVDFVAVLDQDKTSINKDQMPTPPTTKPDITPPTITPPTNPTTPPSNIIVKPVIKENAYQTANSTMGRALRSIRSIHNLQDRYKDYFAFLDNTDTKTMEKTLESLEANSYMQSASGLHYQQHILAQRNMMSALNPSFTSGNLMASLEKDPLLTASIESDVFMDLGLLDKMDKRYIWNLSPNYKKINGDDFDGRSTGLNLTIGGELNENSLLSFGLDVSDTRLDFENANLKNKYFNFSFNHILDLQNFKILSGASLARASNDMTRTIMGQNGSLSSNYDNLLSSLQLGLAKDFQALNNLTLTPLAYFNYNFIKQDAFSENGNLVFAKSYDAINHHTTSLAGGLNLSYLLAQEAMQTKLGSFFIYEYKLSGKTIENNVRFKDFPNQDFVQYHRLNSNLITWGLTSHFIYPNSFFYGFNVVNEFASDQYNINVLGQFGFYF
ncbi:S8 family serine peptidase [Campylobacter upsaliensis]|uniref:Autotransporter domain-containing protein n=1 Tax=Campylobacter upsaliensis TaxID=28080 RepID=A0A7U8B1N7_CAMUP|nr:S8 family serine peptidase [Campylobacter upsaliensis]EAH5878900.1 autotransporter domain-containing protein [Campylobacter upsaliensis]EAH5976617.1 autotransporter domain-containing protein [Campylobacter upsaliensis]EAH6227859.1 autotransporter domain-containing protein [Campylobacter upsaliensis]EAH7983808.1 autotransporter domain-containing protein [Campylobacter upsaliensis]EAH8539417.1 autotransporter domain-containing protein [Campylobacter upsaliensis]